jgi:DNA/RNA endonuclease YhcR with UshA esterase domain
MKTHKITFFFALLGILALIILSQNKPIQTGTISSIQISTNKITINIENTETELILFDPIQTTLKKGDKIQFQGKPDIYKGEKQIIIDKIFVM